MKKEFKAPVIEEMELSSKTSIMDGGILLSLTAAKSGFGISDQEVADQYKQWKGMGN